MQGTAYCSVMGTLDCAIWILVLGVADEIIYDALDASEDKEYTDDAIVTIAEKSRFLTG